MCIIPMFKKIWLSDDYVSNNDLYNLDLNADLAVLSACETGTGPIQKGEGVMSLARGLIPHSKAMETGQWRRGDPMTKRIQSVTGKNLLVVGLGGIGTEVARRASALGMRVTGTRRSSREGPEFVSHVGLSHELHELAAEADFIVNTLPLTPETRGIFDADFFAAAKTGAYFVSVGRGGSHLDASS